MEIPWWTAAWLVTNDGGYSEPEDLEEVVRRFEKMSAKEREDIAFLECMAPIPLPDSEPAMTVPAAAIPALIDLMF
jgi:hypothetical protein